MSNSQSTSGSDNAASFVQLLREELAEIGKLRRKRQWENGKNTCDVDAADARPEQPCVPEPPGTQAGAAGAGQPTADNEADDDHTFREAHREGLVGLSFSGGGIRSATFNLGVLQGLAELRLLPMFDYLSTVSGGGYIGSWLYAWIYRATDPKVAQCKRTAQGEDHSSPIRRVQECLNPDRSNKPDHAEARPIRFLREYSNYLTPRLGFLGADTWTAVAIYLRNLLLNQLILVTFLTSILLLPHIAVWVTNATIGLTCLPHAAFLAPLAASLLILLALTIVTLNMKNLTGIDPGPKAHFPWYSQQGWILALVAGPLFVAAWIAGAWLWDRARSWNVCHQTPLWTSWEWMWIGIFVFGFTWSFASLFNVPKFGPAAPHWSRTGAWISSILFSFISGGVGGMLLGVLTNKFLFNPEDPNVEIWHVVSFGTPLIVVIFLIVGALQIGLMGLFFPDPRREWWARLGGYLFIISIVWTAVFLVAIYSPLGLMWAKGRLQEGLGLTWVVSTLTGIFGGKNSGSGDPDSHTWKDVALSVTPYVFIVGVASGIALLIEACLAVVNHQSAALSAFVDGNPVIQKVSDWVISLDYAANFGDFHGKGKLSLDTSVNPPVTYLQAHWQILDSERICWLLLFLGVCLTVCVFLSWRVNLNEFSMNLFYRNRLVRAYLGASHTGRKPNPFTGFDPHDELQLKDLRADQCYSGPFPIVNSALNLVSGKDLAWQERKAESFVFTPWRCGFDTWLEQIDLDEDSPIQRSTNVQKYGFRPTERYGFSDTGLRLGTVVSISGAAASPNMGYHSSPSLAFLLTLFNVRLGYWAGNPRHNQGWMNPGPKVGLVYLLAELFGQTDDETRYVYLSDGGHFENLGLYELVKRRCKYIIVCDADSDGGYAFGDLGGAIRKCREDIGVAIDLSTGQLTPKTSCPENGAGSKTPTENLSEWHWAVGTINYSLVDPDAENGILVYLKTSITGDEPSDVLNYHREHPDFPHQTTGDQWFTESQFESYRRLGQHVVEELFDPIEQIVSSMHDGTQAAQRSSTKNLFEGLKENWQA